jgi:hypothetical protein
MIVPFRRLYPERLSRHGRSDPYPGAGPTGARRRPEPPAGIAPDPNWRDAMPKLPPGVGPGSDSPTAFPPVKPAAKAPVQPAAPAPAPSTLAVSKGTL